MDEETYEEFKAVVKSRNLQKRKKKREKKEDDNGKPPP